jgi:hypothetical protein
VLVDKGQDSGIVLVNTSDIEYRFPGYPAATYLSLMPLRAAEWGQRNRAGREIS